MAKIVVECDTKEKTMVVTIDGAVVPGAKYFNARFDPDCSYAYDRFNCNVEIEPVIVDGVTYNMYVSAADKNGISGPGGLVMIPKNDKLSTLFERK